MDVRENEKKFLQSLIENGRATDVEIAKKIKITPQAVGKIRKKLEKEGLIKKYSVDLDLEKLGVNMLALFKVGFTTKFWKDYNLCRNSCRCKRQFIFNRRI